MVQTGALQNWIIHFITISRTEISAQTSAFSSPLHYNYVIEFLCRHYYTVLTDQLTLYWKKVHINMQHGPAEKLWRPLVIIPMTARSGVRSECNPNWWKPKYAHTLVVSIFGYCIALFANIQPLNNDHLLYYCWWWPVIWALGIQFAPQQLK